MTLYFQTPDTFDLRALTVFGAHAKPNSTSPIGHFGTGLKFTVATLARNGCSIRLTDPRSALDVRVSSKDSSFRGSVVGELSLEGSVNMVLPYTIELGKNWTPLMAYRELVSNTRDENGAFGSSPKLDLTQCFTIEVSGPAIEEAYASHDKMFFDNPVVIEDFGSFQVCEHHSEPGVFFRGVLVGDLGKSKFTYNFTSQLKLTEDRTCDTNTLEWFIACTLGMAKHQQVLSAILSHESLQPLSQFDKTGTLEHRLRYRPIGRPFAEAALARFERGIMIPDYLISAAYRLLDRKPQRKTFEPTAEQHQMLADAIKVLSANGVVLQHTPQFYSSTNTNIHGQADLTHNELILMESAFEEGLQHLIAVLYEEHLHLTKGLEDESRGMQTYLLNRIAEHMLKHGGPTAMQMSSQSLYAALALVKERTRGDG